MGKAFLVFVLCVLMPLGLWADVGAEREFVSVDGKRLRASPLGYDSIERVVYVKMADGKERNIVADRLSVKDRLFIENNKEKLVEMLFLRRLPRAMRFRFSEAVRKKRVETYGFDAGGEEAIEGFKVWLKKTQNENGSWGDEYRASLTGFGLLVLLGHGETPSDEDYGEVITKGAGYLIRLAMACKGRFAVDVENRNWPYQHAAATQALAELYCVCEAAGIRIQNLEKVVKVAGDIIMNHQHTSGGWDFGYDMTGKRGGDVSNTMWQMQALRACDLTGLWEEKEFAGVVRKALGFIEWHQDASGGIGNWAGVEHPDAGFYLTGSGMYGYQMWGKSHAKVVRKGARYLSKEMKFGYHTVEADLHGLYYNALAMFCRGGKDWEGFVKVLGDQLVVNKDDDGTWKDVGGGKNVVTNRSFFQGEKRLHVHYRSCLCALILQTPYRYVWVAERK